LRIYITGATGYLGLNLLNSIINYNHIEEVRLLAQSESRKKVIFDQLSSADLNTGDYSALSKLSFQYGVLPGVEADLKNIDCLIHIAALRGPELCRFRVKEAIDVNVYGTKCLADAVRKYGCSKTINISTQSIYGKNKVLPWKEYFEPAPTELYSATKYAGELFIKELQSEGFSFINIRPSRLYGLGLGMRNDELLVKFSRNVIRREPLLLYNKGLDTMDFIHIKDMVNFIVNLLNKKDVALWNQVYNAASGEQISIAELVNYYRLISDKLSIGPIRVKEINNGREAKSIHSYLDISKSKKLLNWEPSVLLENGIEEIIVHELNHQ
jgi:UDP-glucose 4-epimerase